MPTFLIVGPELFRHLRQLPNGKGGQLQVVEAVFSRRAIHDQVLRDFPHAIEIANLSFHVSEGLRVDLVGIDLGIALGRKLDARVGVKLAAITVSFGLTSICPAEERHSNRGPNTVFSFGNWRVDAIKENQSLQLFGTGDGAYFDIQCFAVGNDIAIHVPLFEKSEVASLRGLGVQVIVWNESGSPITVPMAVWKNVVAVTIAKSSDGPGDQLELGARRFLEKVFASKTFFALTAGGSTRTYEAAHLPAAHDAFRQSCAEIKENFDAFLALHPANP